MKHVYRFDEEIRDEDPHALLGGKGAGLVEMTRLGIPVPPGLVITTHVCEYYRAHDGTYPKSLEEEVRAALGAVEKRLGRRFGDPDAPLLLSVRSGARISMPGMMDTVLNVGLNDATVEGLAKVSGDRRFAFDAYRRLLQMFGDVVLRVERHRFEHALAELKQKLGTPRMPDSEVPASALEELTAKYRRIIVEEADQPFPEDVNAQLWGTIAAVFRSWDNPRAVTYRRMHQIPNEGGTAVTIQAMVFGNLGDDSGSGVAFTRNPSSGEKALYGEFLANAQGEDVVAGVRTPRPLTVVSAAPGADEDTFEKCMPDAFRTIAQQAQSLETHFRDMQDIEFTIERGTPYILQTRSGKRTAHAAVRIAVDMVGEKLINQEEAVRRVDASSLEQLLRPRLPAPAELEKKGVHAFAMGLPASPGAAIGRVVLDADEAERLASNGEDVILVRRETSPEDIHGMKAAKGVVTATGGMTSHAAVVARGIGKPCVAGTNTLDVDYKLKRITVHEDGDSGFVIEAGEVITVDGTTGRIYAGALDVVAAAALPELEQLMQWADGIRRLRVRTNADTPRDARLARSYGAQGIGLCRTEHMFFAPERLEAVRAMALSGSASERTKWLAVIEPMQQGDFADIFQAMDGLPVTIRLLDWPLHEFLPRNEGEYAATAKALRVSTDEVVRRARALHETNPMLGHRGVRAGLTFPEIYATQARAILRAAGECAVQGISVLPEIMIPIVSLAAELAGARVIVQEAARTVSAELGREVPYKIGTMIELPRACLVADELAETAEFFSFGTNDLTQTTFGISRDDAGAFLPVYMDPSRNLLSADPFMHLDRNGVGALVRIACEKGRKQRSGLSIGICGEHGGDPASIAFCEEVGVDYVSCSPPRLPVARLAAAQAALDARSRA